VEIMGGSNVTELLIELQAGRSGAFDDLLARVYGELRILARAQPPARALPTTRSATAGLVHEAYLKLVDHRGQNWKNRSHFFGAAATAMRRILVDYAPRSIREETRWGTRLA
jgi:RNA polymerase sigma factor (TIGR02999 family)